LKLADTTFKMFGSDVNNVTSSNVMWLTWHNKVY